VDFLIIFVLVALALLIARSILSASHGRRIPRSIAPAQQRPASPSDFFPTVDISGEIQNHPAQAARPVLEGWQQSKDDGIFGIRDRIEQGRPLSREQDFFVNAWTADWTDEERAAFIERAGRHE
jgi:hypothetical protein